MNQEILNNSEDLSLDDIKKYFIDSILNMIQFSFTNDSNQTCAYFMGLLIQNGHIPTDYAFKFFNIIEEPILSKSMASGWVFFLFGCCRKLNNENPLLLNQLFELVDSKITSFQQPAFSLLQQLKEIRKNDFELILNFNYDTKLSNLNHAIHFDDIDFVQNFFSNPKNDINMEYPVSLFEPWYQKNYANPISTICAAALYGSVKCFKYLLLNGASIDDCRSYAIDGGNIEIIRIVEQKLPFEIDSLFQAVELHHDEAFVWLFESKGFVGEEEIDDKSTDGHNENDTRKNDGETVVYKMPKLKNDWALLHSAAMNDDVEMANLFMPFIDINSVNFSNQTPIFTAASSKAINCVRLFLKCPNINLSICEKHTNMNCFLIAVSSKSFDCAVELFNTGCFDINDIQSKMTALSIAASNGDLEMVKFILSIKNIDVNKDNSTLFKAIDSGNADCVKFLLENSNINVNTINRTKETPLLHACNLLDNKEYEKMVKILVNQKGIKLNCRDVYGRTPLLVAAAYKSSEIVSFLLKTPGVKINAREKVFFIIIQKVFKLILWNFI